MRFGKRKRHRKIVRLYAACLGFREPFKVVCDGTFVHHLLLNHIMPAHTALSARLNAPVKIFTNRCVLAELQSLSASHSESLKATRNLFIARCDHERRKAAEDCIKEIIGNDNHEHFFVDTQDDELRKKFQENPLAIQREFAKFTEEECLHVFRSEYKTLMVNQKSSSASEEPMELFGAGGNEGDQILGTQVGSGRKRPEAIRFKRKKKGPNPLSCKKKKDHVHENLGSKKESVNGSEITGRFRNRKRKRSQRSQAAA